MITARQLLTIGILAAGVVYMVPSWHQKYNVESHFGKSISDSMAQRVGLGLIAAAIVLNAQPQYTLYRIKELDFLSPERRRAEKSVENFCGMMDRLEQQQGYQRNAPMNDLDF